MCPFFVDWGNRMEKENKTNLTKENIAEKIEQIKALTQREISLSELCEKLDLNKYQVLGLINSIREEGINISEKRYDDDIYLFNHGEKINNEESNIKFTTDENNEFKFVAISDLRFGSKSQQLSILNDIYAKAYEMGYRNVIICGNITEGLYPINNKYADSTFLDDTLRQVDYITANFPKIEGMKTYFITGKKDHTHMKKNKIDIGKRISSTRSDMIYLGEGNSNVYVDKTKMNIFASSLGKTYTVSYRPQQQIDSFRSEDKPEIILCGGLLQMEKFNYRNVNCISVPSVCATTEEMEDKRQTNTVGAWYITVKNNEKGNLESINAIDSVYYVTQKDDYKISKALNINKGVKKTANIKEEQNEDLEFINRIYKYIRNNMPVEEFMSKFHINSSELTGIMELCRIYGKGLKIEISNNGEACFKKEPLKKITNGITKPNLDDLVHTQICVVSDTHFGNIHQQIHLLNQIYEEAYKRGITTVLHCGDMTDGNYLNRPESPRQQFLHGFDEQANYIAKMYPLVDGITTKYILGSHDETHYKNGGATINNFILDRRNDMIYCGQDTGTVDINGIKIVMDHPGGGSASSLSYKPQKRIEILESGCKPKILLIGHYHKSYEFTYRNVRGIEVPCLCDKTQFQQKQGLSNYVGAYFLDIYSDSKGNIQYFEPEEILFDHKDMWDEAGKDRKKVKQLIIK